MKKILIVIISLSIILTACQPEEISTYKDVATNEITIDGLKSQLKIAIVSGGITPENFKEINDRVDELERQGYDKEQIQELREMLSQLSVGGESKKEALKLVEERQEEPTIQNDSNKEVIETQKIVTWDYRDGAWGPQGEAPACPEPLVFQSPVNLNLVTSILYPGQIRGNDFKPHGGFRTNGASGPIEVRAPIEGYVWRAVRFYDDAGIHYMFDIQNPCGIMYRLGHLGAVSPKFQAIADKLPEPKIKDSRTTMVEPVFVELGEVIATNTQEGTGFDWGVYDLRQENEASKNLSFRELHMDEPDQALHAICWLNYLPDDQEAIVKSLPGADGISGKNSDYC